MTLSELLEALAATTTIPACRLKDLKTSLRYLAKALGKPSPDACHDDEFLLPAAAWKAQLEAYFSALPTPVSGHTVRNTHTNLRYVFREAEACGIIKPITARPRIITREAAVQMLLQDSLFRHRPRDQWPPALQAGWERYRMRRRMALRDTTLGRVRQDLESYVGYLMGVAHLPLTQWGDLFAIDHLDRFIHWHSARHQMRITYTARHLGESLRTIARFEDHPQAPALTAYVRALPRPDPLRDKKHFWFSLRELEEVALGLLQDAHRPLIGYILPTTRSPGLKRAILHARSLMLRILVRIPLRQRNIREMQLQRNLFYAHGHWQLAFKGEELKIARRRGGINRFGVDLSKEFPELIPHIEEYLQLYRPRYPNARQSPFVFLTQYGHPYKYNSLTVELQEQVYVRTQKYFYPHLIRTIWATEMLERGVNLDTVAYMLNDDPITVLKEYHELFGERHAEKASRVLRNILTTNGVSTSDH
jgi:hypothetical protein